MTIMPKKEMEKLMKSYPNGGVVFQECNSNLEPYNDLMVTTNSFGALYVIPKEGEVITWDWNIKESWDTDHFAVYDHSDILQMIQILTSGLKIELKYGFK